MMQEPAPLRKEIDPAALDERNYAQSLLEAALRAGLADEALARRVREELLAALAEACRAYTGGMSGSLRAETASELMASLVCALDAWLLSFPAAEDALAALRQTGAAQGCRLGARRLRALLGPTRTFHAVLLRASIRTENELYNGTLREGLSAFFGCTTPFSARTAFTSLQITPSAFTRRAFAALRSSGVIFKISPTKTRFCVCSGPRRWTPASPALRAFTRQACGSCTRIYMRSCSRRRWPAR